MSPERTAVVMQLRRHLAQIAPHRGIAAHSPRLPTGISALDAAIGGWPRPGISAIHGPVGSGRLALILPHMRTRGNIFIVDSRSWLYPPGFPDSAQLVLIRPGAVRAGWATAQLARSGALPLIVLLDPPRLGRDGRRILHAAEAGHTAVIAITEAPDPDLPATVRIAITRNRRVRLLRGGPQGLEFALPHATVAPCVHSSVPSSDSSSERSRHEPIPGRKGSPTHGC